MHAAVESTSKTTPIPTITAAGFFILGHTGTFIWKYGNWK